MRLRIGISVCLLVCLTIGIRQFLLVGMLPHDPTPVPDHASSPFDGQETAAPFPISAFPKVADRPPEPAPLRSAREPGAPTPPLANPSQAALSPVSDAPIYLPSVEFEGVSARAPAVLAPLPSDLPLTPEQIAKIDWLADQFAEFADALHASFSPDDPAYAEAWNAQTEAFDRYFKLHFGRHAWVRMNLAAAQAIYQEPSGDP